MNEFHVPVVPVVAHGSHNSVVGLSRGDRVARALGLGRVKVHVMPGLLGLPFGAVPVLPPVPLPAKVTVDFLPSLEGLGDSVLVVGDEVKITIDVEATRQT